MRNLNLNNEVEIINNLKSQISEAIENLPLRKLAEKLQNIKAYAIVNYKQIHSMNENETIEANKESELWRILAYLNRVDSTHIVMQTYDFLNSFIVENGSKEKYESERFKIEL